MLKFTIIAVLVALASAAVAPGGFVSQETIGADAYEMANWAANAMSSTNEMHTVVAVRDLQTQVVAGMIYKFNLELSVNNQAVKVCSVEIFDQSWTKTRQFNKEPSCSILNIRPRAVGGYTPKAVNEEVLSLARWAAASFQEGQHAVVAVTNYRTQLVAGVNHKFTLELLVDNVTKKTCEMSIFTQAWTSTVQNFEEPKCTTAKVARAVGGYVPAVVNDEVKELASWAAASFQESKHSVVAITNYRTQVVSGMNHKFTLELLDGNKVSKTCEMSIFVQSWTNTRKFIEEPRCSGSRAGQFSASEVTEKIKEIASWSAAALSTEDKHTVVEITNVQKQIVNGINYKFTLSLNVEGKAAKTCEMSVFDQAWTNTRHFFAEPRCSGARALVGGFVEQPVVSAQTMEVAQWAAATMSTMANEQFQAVNGVAGHFQHGVSAVKNVRTQVVNGINYKFTLEVTVSHPPSMAILKKSCEMNVYVNPWTNVRKFNEAPVCNGGL